MTNFYLTAMRTSLRKFGAAITATPEYRTCDACHYDGVVVCEPCRATFYRSLVQPHFDALNGINNERNL